MCCRSVTFQPIILVLLSALTAASVSVAEPNAKVRVVCTTTMIADLAREIVAALKRRFRD